MTQLVTSVRAPESGDEFLGFATPYRRESLRADLALQGVHGLTAIEDLVDRAAKIRQCEMVAQIYGAQQLPERVAGPMDSIASGIGAEAL